MEGTEAQVVLTKSLFESKYSHEKGVTKKQAGEIYDTVFGYVHETLLNNGRVRIPGVGVLYLDDVDAAEYRIPKTNVRVTKGPRKRFRLSSKPFYMH